MACPWSWSAVNAITRTINGYVQVTEYGQRAEFEPHEIIHIPYDSLPTGSSRLSPTAAAMLPITCWPFATENPKQVFRRGNAPAVHIDMSAGMSPSTGATPASATAPGPSPATTSRSWRTA